MNVNKQSILTFFKPSFWTAIILGIFVPVALLGHIQTWGFTYDEVDRQEHPPPFLYDQIRDYPFWIIWVVSIAPLIPFTTAVQSLLNNFEGSLYVFLAMNFMYYYLSSCVIGFLWRMIRPKKMNDDSAPVTS